jgi:hypothetical protein
MDEEGTALVSRSRRRYIEALRVALASWHDLRVDWANILRGTGLSDDGRRQAEQAIAECESEIRRLDALLELQKPARRP